MELYDCARFFASFVLLLSSAVILWLIYRRIHSYVYKLPPGPTVSVPLLGYLPFIIQDPQKKIYELGKKYGPIMSVSFGPYTVIVVSDHDHTKELLSHPACLGRPDRFLDFLPYGAGFVGMNGEQWQEQRRFCMHIMRDLGIGKGKWERIIQDDVVEFLEYLGKWTGKPVNVNRPLSLTGISSIASLMVGRRFPDKETNPDVKVIEKAHHVITEHGKLSNPAFAMPFLLKYMVKFNIAGYRGKMKVLDDLSGLFRREIVKHQDCKDNLDHSDFIGRYLDVLDRKDVTDSNKYYSVDNLAGHLIAFFIGGSDTIVASLSWLLVLMTEYPQVQAKVQEEIDDVFGRDGQNSWDDRKNLPYTMATILEMERWSSILPFFPPRSVSETFEFHGYTIPKGAIIFTNSWAIHRDPKYWDNPEEFRPERFLQTAEKSGKHSSKLDGYGPFSYGKRSCPGETVAMMTLFLYFTGVMQKFSVKMPPGCCANLRMHYSGIVHPPSQELCFIER